MGFSTEISTVKMIANIEVDQEKENKKVYFVVKDLNNKKIELTDSNVEDLKEFFDNIFEYIISNKQLIEFNLIEEKRDLFFEVAYDLVEHLNHEIKQSEDNFIKLIELENLIK